MADDEMLMMAPGRLAAIMARAAACAHKKPPLRLTPSTRSHSSSWRARNSERGNTPALFTRMSGGPSAVAAVATKARTSALRATSPLTVVVLRPRPRTSSATRPAAAASSVKYSPDSAPARAVETVAPDVGPSPRHRHRDRAADPLLRARDERDLSRKPHVRPPVSTRNRVPPAIIGGRTTMPRKPTDVTMKTFRAGEVIFREGDPPRDEAYMVHLGRVEVRKQVGNEQRVLHVMRKGELLGELGLFGKSRRSATAVALEPVTLMVIPARKLDQLVRTNPALAVAIIRDLSLKLLATNELLAEEGRRRTRGAR